MTLNWTEPQTGAFSDGYLDWSDVLKKRGSRPANEDGQWFHPVFVRLCEQAERGALLQALQQRDRHLAIEPHELEHLKKRCGKSDSFHGLPDEYALYLRADVDAALFSDLFEVLDWSAPVLMPAGASDPEKTCEATPPTIEPARRGQPIVAVLDDGVGFLNSRFCRKTGNDGLETRFLGVWIQSAERLVADTACVVSGRTFSARQVNTLLARHDETGTYEAINSEIFERDIRKATAFGTSHGTHVLDVAAGASPDQDGDPARDWPLLAVQLPPEAVADTSGTYLEGYLMRGLRWTLFQAHAADPTAPVIVNISMGITAGPKDGSRFAEYQIAREAENWERVTGQPVRIVWAFGNNYHSRLIAGLSVCEGETEHLTWRVQPADQTASYLELHASGQDSRLVELSLVTPEGLASGFAEIPPGDFRDLQAGGQPVARIYHVPARRLSETTLTRAHYLLALAPTEARASGEPVAPSGAWRVGVQVHGGSELSIVAQIQRDDSLHGYPILGRQSYFDHPCAYGWDDQDQSYSQLTKGGPITSQGSHNALVTSPARQVFSAGAAVGCCPSRSKPSAYTAQGADWSVAGPTVSALADLSGGFRGVKGTGTLSGSIRFLNGTSAASAIITRALALSADRIKENARDPETGRLDDFDPSLLEMADADDPTRSGRWVVEPVRNQSTDMPRVDLTCTNL